MNILRRLTDFVEEEIDSLSCVYTITNTIDGKMHVGATTDLLQRMRYHTRYLLSGKHFNEHLQNAVIRDGIHNFRFEILEKVDPDLVFEVECFWINMLGVIIGRYGYNKRVVFKGGRLSEDNRRVIAFTDSGIYIQEFRNQIDAGEYFGLSPTIISSVINCKLPSIRSLYFMRAKDYVEFGFRKCANEMYYEERIGFHSNNFRIGKEVRFNSTFQEADRRAEFEEFYQLRRA